MLKNYKKSYLVINIILGLMLTFIIFNLLVFKKSNYEFLTLSILIPTALLILIYGYEKKNRRFKYELAFYIFFYCVLFLLVTYIAGLFIGFTSNVYKLNLANLIHNMIPYALLIFISETLRYQISRKGDGSILSFILVTLVMILVDLGLFLATYDLSTGDGQIKYICAIILPSIFKNVALLYFTKRGGMLPSLIYRILLDFKLVVLPIFPKFGIYFDSVINTILPALMMFIIHIQIKPYIVEEEKPNYNLKKMVFVKYVVFTILFIVVLAINLLSSNVFKYRIIAIGSGSMTPNIYKGDAIIYKILNKNYDPQVGEILVFRKESKIIVHRIIEVVDIGNDEKVYYTQGDANANPDGYTIERSSIVGTVKARVRYIGIPSVALQEVISR